MTLAFAFFFIGACLNMPPMPPGILLHLGYHALPLRARRRARAMTHCTLSLVPSDYLRCALPMHAARGACTLLGTRACTPSHFSENSDASASTEAAACTHALERTGIGINTALIACTLAHFHLGERGRQTACIQKSYLLTYLRVLPPTWHCGMHAHMHAKAYYDALCVLAESGICVAIWVAA